MQYDGDKGSPAAKSEYMRIHSKYFSNRFRKLYKIEDKIDGYGYVYLYCVILRGMYGLKQAAILAYQHLKNSLEPYGYYPVQVIIGMYQHNKRPTKFCLCVDDFGVKYWSKADDDHLYNSVRANF